MSRAAKGQGRVFVVGPTAIVDLLSQARVISVECGLDRLSGLREADVVVLDTHTASAAQLTEALTAMASRPAAPGVLVIGGPAPTALVRVLIRLDRSDIVDAPYEGSDIAQAVIRLLDTAPGEARPSGRLFSVMGAVGGAGATTVAVEIASALARTAANGAKTCLVDLNLCDGAASAYLGAVPAMRMGEFQMGADRVDRALFGALVAQITPRFDLLAAPRDPSAFADTDPETLLKILDVACETYDYVIADMPRHRQPWSRQVLQGSDEILVISELTVPALLAARALADELGHAAPEGPTPHIIINRLASRFMGPAPSLAEAEKALGRKAFAGITSDWEAAAASVNLGGAISQHRAKSKIVRDIEALSQRLMTDASPRGGQKEAA